ncbi:MAG: hypothetical protein ACTSO3_16920 [Candidatus Heimdallarchaeaceae archaeon]
MKGISETLISIFKMVLIVLIFAAFAGILIFYVAPYFGLAENVFESSESSYSPFPENQLPDASLVYSGFILDPQGGITTNDLTEDLTDAQICEEIEACLLYHENENEGCVVYENERSDGSTFPIDELVTIIRNCPKKILTVENVDYGFDTTNFVKEEIGPPQSFYYNIKAAIHWDRDDPDLFVNNIYDSRGAVNRLNCQESVDLCKPHQVVDFPDPPYGSNYDTSQWILYATMRPGGSGKSHLAILNEADETVIVKKEKVDDHTFNFAKNIAWPTDNNGVRAVKEVDKITGASLPTTLDIIVGVASLTGPLTMFSGNPLDSFFVELYNPSYVERDLSGLSYSVCNMPPERIEASNKIYYDDYSPAARISSDKRGNVKVSVGKIERTSTFDYKFNVYVCSQDAFIPEETYYKENVITEIYEFFRNFDALGNLYIYDNTDTDAHEKEEFVVRYNYFEFELDRDYRVEEIETAILSGLRDWSRSSFPYQSHISGLTWLDANNIDGIAVGHYERGMPSWFPGVNDLLFENGCASTPDKADVTGNMFTRDQKTIYYKCSETADFDPITGKVDYMCRKGKLRVTVSFKGYMPGTKGDKIHPFKRPLWPTITFCSENR